MRPAHPICGWSAGRPLSRKGRKMRFCALQHAATQRARDSGSSPAPCPVSRANIYPLRRCRRLWPARLRERRKSDFSLFGGPQCERGEIRKMFGRGSERLGVCFETYSNVYQPVGSLESNLTFFIMTLNQVPRARWRLVCISYTSSREKSRVSSRGTRLLHRFLLFLANKRYYYCYSRDD